ncbi:MAG: LamG-like jellyroll fold domain-containing protein [Microcystaceae cyanobacterium]
MESEYASLTGLQDYFAQFFHKFDALVNQHNNWNNVSSVEYAESLVSQYNPKLNPANNHWYLLARKDNWWNSQSLALSLGGHLVTINNQEEQLWLYNSFGYTRYWTGLHDSVHEGRWEWVSGEPYQREWWQWAPGEPNNSENEDYVHTLRTWRGENRPNNIWNDTEPGGARNHGMIEIKFDDLKIWNNHKNTALQSLRNATISAFNELQQLRDLLNENDFASLVDGIDVSFVNTYLQEYYEIYNQAGGNLDEATLKRLQNEVFQPFSNAYHNLSTASSVEELIVERRPSLIVSLDQELTYKIDGLVKKIDLTNDAQEQWLETNLQSYLEEKQDDAIQTKDQHLSLIQQSVRPSRALYFDGVNDSVNMGVKASLKVSNALTIESWINPQQQLKSDGGIIVHKEGEYGIAVWGDGTIRWAFANSKPGWKWLNTGYKVETNKWTHIAVSYENGLIQTYANGSLVHKYDGVGKIGDKYTSWNEFHIGGRQKGSKYFKGEIDEVRVWNVARNQAEIQGNLNQRLIGNEEGLVGYWSFEEDAGKIVDDLTANQNHGELIDGVQRTIDREITLPQESKKRIKSIEETAIIDLQNLRIETTYLTLQTEQDPDKLQDYFETLEFIGWREEEHWKISLNDLRNQYYPALADATTLSNLKQQINNELTNTQTEYQTLKGQIADKKANASAALTQADWYEEQAQIHWELSRKQGPTWKERRKAKGKSGKSKTITIVHVDHHWIIWDAYTQQATSLKQYVANLGQEIDSDTAQKDLTADLIEQWQSANAVADEASITYDQFIAQLEALEAQRQLQTAEQKQLDTFKQLLPTLQEELTQAQQAAETAKANTIQAQQDYEATSATYQQALEDVLLKKVTVDTETQNLLQQITNTHIWVEQQLLTLDTEIAQTSASQQQLQSELDTLTDTDNLEILTKKVQIQESIDLLTHKETILTAQKSALTQKITLLNAQQTVIETEYELINATITSPDDDYSNLEAQLEAVKETLAKIQALAQQAENTSIILTSQLEDLQAFIKEQNDQYLAEIQAKQETLQALITATELQENYTLQAAEKQNQLNTLESELMIRLQEATDAGSQEAQHLLEVASANNFATAAEIYWRDYRDLMTDTGGGCAGGIARPDDAIKADYYYQEMLKYRALEDKAQQQADYFNQLKTAAQEQIDLIEQQQSVAQLEYNELQSQIEDIQGDVSDLEQTLALVEIRINGLEYLRNWTEQIQLQLLSVEQLNLAQAQLEKEIAQARKDGIDQTIEDLYNKQQADLNRERAIATAKIEQLNQLESEDALQQALNDLREDLGLQPIEYIVKLAEYKGQLAGIAADLENYKLDKTLPDHIQTLFDETQASLYDAIQGKEAATIQDNLLQSANALIEEATRLQTKINEYETEEDKLLGILNQSETDLQGATKALYDEIQAANALGDEYEEINQEYLEILYQIGYAQGAVDLSSELAQQSKTILDQIINSRVQERKARKKAAFNEIFGTVTLALSAVAAVATAGASLAAGNLVQPAISTTLISISSGLSAVQAAYNGDWSGAVFNAGMAALGAAELGGFQVPDLGLGLEHIDKFSKIQQIASGVYNGYQSFEGGDGLTGFLSLTNAVFALGLPDYNYLSQAALSINSGVQLAEEDNWLAATASFLNAAVALGKNIDFVNDDPFWSSVTEVLRAVELTLNFVSGIQTIIDDGSLEGWLQGIQQIANGAVSYIKYEPPKNPIIPLHSITEQDINELALRKAGNEASLTEIDETKNNLSNLLNRLKNYQHSENSDFTKDEFENFILEKFVFNDQFNSVLLSSIGNLKIKNFQTQEDQDEHDYFSKKYPDYANFSAHKDAVAITHIISGMAIDDLSKSQAGLGFTGIKDYGLNIKATFSDQWRKRTTFHDVTSTLQIKLKTIAPDAPSLNKIFFGVEDIVISAITGVGIPATIEEIFDLDLEEVVDPIYQLFQFAVKPLDWITQQIDPLVIDLEGDGIELINIERSSTLFDLDADGYLENVSWTTDALLTVDLNNDGTINNITELFSEYFNDGSANSGIESLTTYDTNNNGIISAVDDQFDQILVWQDQNQDGISQPNELKTLTEHGITSINLNARRNADPCGIALNTIQDGNIIKKRSIFNRNDGTSGEISDIAFLVTQTGFKVSQTDTGLQIIAENDETVSLFIHEDSTDLTLNLADINVQVAIGNIGNDTLYTTDTIDVFLSGEAGNDHLTGNSGNDWLIGDEGADRLKAEAGDDLLYIDAQDTLIDGGEGSDIAIVTTSDAVTLNLGDSNLEMAIGNDGNDTFTHSGAYAIVAEGGKGNDQLYGGNDNDLLNGNEGDDSLHGGLGDDILTGGGGKDTFIYHSVHEGMDTITDFAIGSDRIELGNQINSSSLSVSLVGNDWLLSYNDQVFATLKGIQKPDLTISELVM